jgi:hypothetical protein
MRTPVVASVTWQKSELFAERRREGCLVAIADGISNLTHCKIR